MKQHYTTLGLQEGASQEEIEGAYKRLSKELDPANNDNQEFFIEEFAVIRFPFMSSEIIYIFKFLLNESGSCIMLTLFIAPKFGGIEYAMLL